MILRINFMYSLPVSAYLPRKRSEVGAGGKFTRADFIYDTDLDLLIFWPDEFEDRQSNRAVILFAALLPLALSPARQVELFFRLIENFPTCLLNLLPCQSC